MSIRAGLVFHYKPLELEATFTQGEIRLFALRISTAYQEHVLAI